MEELVGARLQHLRIQLANPLPYEVELGLSSSCKTLSLC